MGAEDRWRLRPAVASDLEFLARLRNDSVSAHFSRRGVLSVDVIRNEFIDSRHRHSFVSLCGEEEVGYARFDFDSMEATVGSPEISIALVPQRRGDGLGAALVAAATAFAFEHWEDQELHELLARVHRENAASLRCFERAGYLRSAVSIEPFSRWSKARRQ